MLFAIFEPYRRARLTSFLDPWDHASGAGFQAVQGQIAIGSGGLFGHGLGASIQKIFYVPEAHTDFILAVIGEELGLAGILGLLSLYGIIGYAGLRTARNAKGIYAKLARRRPDLTDPVPSHAQRLRRPRPRAADRRPAAVHLVRLDVADRRCSARWACCSTSRRGGHAHALQRRPADRRPPVTEPPRIVIAAGGTAGHVVPAIAVADALRAEGAEVSFVGGERAEAELVPKAGYELDPINVEGISRTNPLKAARARRQGGRRARQAARKILKQRKADAVLGGGGYVAGPVGLAAATSKIPLVLTEADSHLGLTNRALASRAPPRLPRLPARGPRRRPLPRHRPRRPARRTPTARTPAPSSGSGPTRPACSSSAARSARARSTPPPRGVQGRALPRRPRRRHARLPGPDEPRPALRPARLPDAVRDRARRRGRRRRPLRRLGLRARPVRPARGPDPVSARLRRPPDHQREVDGRPRRRARSCPTPS